MTKYILFITLFVGCGYAFNVKSNGTTNVPDHHLNFKCKSRGYHAINGYYNTSSVTECSNSEVVCYRMSGGLSCIKK